MFSRVFPYARMSETWRAIPGTYWFYVGNLAANYFTIPGTCWTYMVMLGQITGTCWTHSRLIVVLAQISRVNSRNLAEHVKIAKVLSWKINGTIKNKYNTVPIRTAAHTCNSFVSQFLSYHNGALCVCSTHVQNTHSKNS